MNNRKRIISAILAALLMIPVISAGGESPEWVCPDCGRTGNRGNFCGNCGHPSPTPGPEPTPAPDKTSQKSEQMKQPGAVITFGTYPQTAAGTDRTPVKWIVLDYDENQHKALLLSKYGLDVKPYNTGLVRTTWEGCSLRSWLNDEFLQSAFSAEEQAAVLVTAVDNSSGQGNSKWDTDGGNNTQDRIFLLSCAEANRYLGVTGDNGDNTKVRITLTSYAIAKGAYLNKTHLTSEGKPAGCWWLRSPGNSLDSAAYVGTGGSLRSDSVSRSGPVVRPAFWVNVESGIF